MEDYIQLSQNSAQRGSFLYGGSLLAPNSSVYGRTGSGNSDNQQQRNLPINGFQLQSGNPYYQSDSRDHHPHPVVKTEEAGNSKLPEKFYSPSMISDHQQLQRENEDNTKDVDALKAKIISHPQYSNLLDAYIDCQKVGAPAEVVERLTVVRQEFDRRQRAPATGVDGPKDPELDQFMEAYCDMLVKYREELTRPLQEAMEFIRRIEAQLNMLSNGAVRVFKSDDKCDGIFSSEEDQDKSGGETELSDQIDPRAEERELKNHLLKKYSGYLTSLRQELSKKKKKGKLPKDAREKLLSWWELHYKWPYPSETEKMILAESTGLDQKQINNWFINQRKRHWKPSEDMQFMVMDGLHPQNAAIYFEGHYMGEGPYLLGP